MEKELNIHKADHDYRKIDAVRKLVKKFPLAVEYWSNSGLTERKKTSTGDSIHKHGAISHQLGGAMVVDTISSLMVDLQIINVDQRDEAIESFLLHDADKPTDMKFINLAIGDDKDKLNWEEVEKVGNTIDIDDKDKILARLRRDYGNYFNSNITLGDRIHILRSIVANAFHKERLKVNGFSEKIIEIQSSVEYVGCDETDTLIDRFNDLDVQEKGLAIQKIIVCFVDNCMMEGEMVNPIKRTESVFKKPFNIALNTEWSKWNKKGETAEAKQIRVSKKQQDFLSKLLGIKSKEFMNYLESEVKKKILS